MSISRELADALHTIVDHLPWRDEQPQRDTHATIEAEVEKSADEETDQHE